MISRGGQFILTSRFKLEDELFTDETNEFELNDGEEVSSTNTTIGSDEDVEFFR